MPTYRELPTLDQYAGDTDRSEIQLIYDVDDSLPIVYSDGYVTLVKDRVQFPTGKTGTYLRLFSAAELSGQHGVVIVPVFANKLILLQIFRHPTRAWELEFPRGFAETGQTPEENAHRETLEELGVQVVELKPIGLICPNSGILATRANAFIAQLQQFPEIAAIDGIEESIHSAIQVTKDEFLTLVADGKIRCGFTLAAFTIAAAKGLI